jgi:hypothetical protein
MIIGRRQPFMVAAFFTAGVPLGQPAIRMPALLVDRTVAGPLDMTTGSYCMWEFARSLVSQVRQEDGHDRIMLVSSAMG